jgi:hypothetical protein
MAAMTGGIPAQAMQAASSGAEISPEGGVRFRPERPPMSSLLQVNNADESIIAFLRKAKDRAVLFAAKFSAVSRPEVRVENCEI